MFCCVLMYFGVCSACFCVLYIYIYIYIYTFVVFFFYVCVFFCVIMRYVVLCVFALFNMSNADMTSLTM